MKRIIFALCLLIAVTSCVSKKKYMVAENGRLAALSRERVLNRNLGQQKDEIAKLKQQITDLMSDTTRLGQAIRDYRKSLYSNLSEQEKLNMLLKEKMEKLSEREATINKLQAEVDAQNARLQSLLNSVKDALLGFSSDELTVTEKNGKIYVAMSDKLLFESGSAQVNKQGKEALGKLAEVLKKQHDIDVFIEGHTDNKPIKTVQFKDNWDLSVVRATSVVRILTKDYGVNPLQILPCGRGEFMPVDNNESVEGRAHNRRTEIIMAPKLDKLMDILK
ncbi:OmpA family protein [Odoribacter sp. N15.MGS-14]|uniref:OmpA/MotB family protein n=1 Tax=Odoribacter sp. N15.MGS-14 TaxID=1637502 RepID=UPI0006239D1E|nr:OmpA family protein [Odoribacter sp. N15.MGS-14]